MFWFGSGLRLARLALPGSRELAYFFCFQKLYFFFALKIKEKNVGK